MFYESKNCYKKMKCHLAHLLMMRSYKEGHFILASGRESDYYFDCRITSLSCDGAFLIGNLFCGAISYLNRSRGDDNTIVGVAGMTMGADPLITATMMSSVNEQYPLSGLIIRKQAKDHGTTQWVEGLANFKPGNQIVMLEDVVTTGGSLLKACKRIEDAGLKIVACMAILDREEGGSEKIREANYPFLPIFTRSSLKEYAKKFEEMQASSLKEDMDRIARNSILGALGSHHVLY